MNNHDDSELELARFFPYQISVLASRISRRLLAEYRDEFDLNVSEWRVIAHIARCDRVSVREIHNCVNLDKPTVSRAVRRLVSEDMLGREPSQDDKRLIEISLTPKGRRTFEKIASSALKVENDLLSSFSAKEVKGMVSAFEKLHQKLDADDRAPKRSMLDVINSEDK